MPNNSTARENLTKERREELRRLVEAMTQGEWRAVLYECSTTVKHSGKTDVIHWMGFDDSDRPRCEHHANAIGIVALRNAAIALLDALDEADIEIQAAMETLEYAEKDRRTLTAARDAALARADKAESDGSKSRLKRARRTHAVYHKDCNIRGPHPKEFA
jgi:hypothetical protein